MRQGGTGRKAIPLPLPEPSGASLFNAAAAGDEPLCCSIGVNWPSRKEARRRRLSAIQHDVCECILGKGARNLIVIVSREGLRFFLTPGDGAQILVDQK
jgi:hypothetical protein